MDRRPFAAFAAALAAIAASAVPGLASPVTDGGTTATIVLTAAGSVSVTAPDDTTPINLATVAYGTGPAAVTWPGAAASIGDLFTDLGVADASGQLGVMTVVDSRTGLITGWSGTVSWTDFDLPTVTDATHTIEAANLRYSSGAAISSGLGALTPSLAPVSTGGAFGSYVGLLQTTGTDTVTWNPTIFIDLQGEVAGTFTGVITHSITAS